MKTAQRLFLMLGRVALVGMGVLFLYVEWRCVQLSLANLCNPFVHVAAIYILATLPLFQFLLGSAVLGYLGCSIVRKRAAQSSEEH